MACPKNRKENGFPKRSRRSLKARFVTALQKHLVQFFTADTRKQRRVSKAHSPQRTGVGFTDPVVRIKSVFPRSYERNYEHKPKPLRATDIAHRANGEQTDHQKSFQSPDRDDRPLHNMQKIV